MGPGQAVWNRLLTPHWVIDAEEVTLTISLSHGGLRRHGKLGPNDEILQAHFDRVGKRF